MSSFEIHMLPRQNPKSGMIGFFFTSLDETVLKIHVTEVLVKLETSQSFLDHDFSILPYSSGCSADRSFCIELDPRESRDYGVSLKGDVVASFDFRITATDKSGRKSTVEGHREGIPATELQQHHETDLVTPTLGMLVRKKSTPYSRCDGKKFEICEEDGTPHDIGIFNRHEMNPPAAYIDIGRDGYKRLVGKFSSELDWDRDTAANPPSDLWAVHIRNLEKPSEHGWMFRSDLLITDASVTHK